MSPYRRPADVERPAAPGEPCPDVDALPVIAFVWAGSVVRCWAYLAHGEAQSAEASLAVVCVVFLPLLFKDAAAWWWRRKAQAT